MNKIEYEMLRVLSLRNGMQDIEFTTLFFEEYTLKKRQAAAKAKLDKFEKLGLIRKKQNYPTPSPTYELTEDGVRLMKGVKYPISILGELSEDDYIDVEESLPEVGQPVWVVAKVGSRSSYILIRADVLMPRGKFSCEIDWVSVLYWKPFDK